MAVSTVARIERREETAQSRAPRFVFPTFRSLRHGAPAATYSDRIRGSEAISHDATDRMLFEDWGWA